MEVMPQKFWASIVLNSSKEKVKGKKQKEKEKGKKEKKKKKGKNKNKNTKENSSVFSFFIFLDANFSRQNWMFETGLTLLSEKRSSSSSFWALKEGQGSHV